MLFIEVTDKDGARNAVNAETVRRVIEYESGCFIVTCEDSRRVFGFEVQEIYHTVMRMLRGF